MTDNEINEIANVFWGYLKRDPEHKDRRQTAWGTKTKKGLTATIIRLGAHARLKESSEPSEIAIQFLDVSGAVIRRTTCKPSIAPTEIMVPTTTETLFIEGR